MRSKNHNNSHSHGYNYKSAHHEKSEKVTNCERCGADLDGRFGYSVFDSFCICAKCKHQETNYPDYDKALERHKQEILAGNYAFKGIGTPKGL